MMKNKLNNFILSISLVTLSIFFVGQPLEAALVYTQPAPAVSAGDVFIVELLLDTEGATINTIDGAIGFSNKVSAVEVRDLSTAGSAFTLWPRRPSLSEKGDTISFVGGAPGGISGQHIPILKVILSVPDQSNLSLVAKGITLYLNDGKGTALAATTKFTPIPVGYAKTNPTDSWRDTIAKDNTPPEQFTVELHKEKTLYEGKKFLSFSTTDEDSGLSHYEVKEGDSSPVRTGETYILVDQEHKNDIVVFAYDKAGNIMVATLPLKSNRIQWGTIIVVVAIAVAIYILRKRWRKKKYAGR